MTGWWVRILNLLTHVFLAAWGPLWLGSAEHEEFAAKPSGSDELTFELDKIRNCTLAFRDSVAAKNYSDVHDKLTKGCTFFQYYIRCLTVSVNDPDFPQYYRGNQTVGNSTASSVLNNWRYVVLQSSTLFRELGLCPHLNASTLEQKIKPLPKSKRKLKVSKDKQRCYMFFQCFTSLLDDMKTKPTCKAIDSYITCGIKTQKKSCSTMKALKQYAKVLIKLWKPTLVDLEAVPGFCDSLNAVGSYA